MYSVLLFGADWCSGCKQLEKTLDQIVAKNPSFNYSHIDSEDNDELVSKYQIMSLPTFLILYDDKVVLRKTGSFSISEAEQLLRSYKLI